jgi:hypothetical protein
MTARAGFGLRIQLLVALAAASASCVGSCDMVADVKPLGGALEMRRMEGTFSVYRRAIVVRGEDEITVDALGWNSTTAVLVTDAQHTGRPGRTWHVADVTTGRISGPFDEDQFEAELRARPELRSIPIRGPDVAWDSLER